METKYSVLSRSQWGNQRPDFGHVSVVSVVRVAEDVRVVAGDWRGSGNGPAFNRPAVWVGWPELPQPLRAGRGEMGRLSPGAFQLLKVGVMRKIAPNGEGVTSKVGEEPGEKTSGSYGKKALQVGGNW